MVEELREYILQQIEHLEKKEQREILQELAGDLRIMAEGMAE